MSEIQNQYKAFVARLFNRTGDLSKDFAHAVQGIVTECFELRTAKDETNATEEAGDLTFFVYALNIVLDDLSVQNGYMPSVEEADARWAIYDHGLTFPPAQVIEEFNIDLLDISKRWVGYGKKPTDLGAIATKARIVRCLALAHCDCQNVDDEYLMKTNMAKLLKRYPAGEFDQYRALVRDVGAENEAIRAV